MLEQVPVCSFDWHKITYIKFGFSDIAQLPLQNSQNEPHEGNQDPKQPESDSRTMKVSDHPPRSIPGLDRSQMAQAIIPIIPLRTPSSIASASTKTFRKIPSILQCQHNASPWIMPKRGFALDR